MDNLREFSWIFFPMNYFFKGLVNSSILNFKLYFLIAIIEYKIVNNTNMNILSHNLKIKTRQGRQVW